MNLPTLGRRPFPVADRTRDGELYRHMHPRLAAIDLLQTKIADRKAGLDPYDHSIFILVALPHETVWANRALELVGHVLSTSTDMEDGGKRFRAVLEADVRVELNLDYARRPPIMDDEPLASRAVAPDDAILQVVHPAQPQLELIEGGGEDKAPVPVMRAALERAAQLAALRVECGCGAPAHTACRCTAAARLASAAANGALVDDETEALEAAHSCGLRDERWLTQRPHTPEVH